MAVEEKVDKMKRKRVRPKLTKLTIEKQTTQPKEVRRGKIQYTPRNRKLGSPRGSLRSGDERHLNPHPGQHTFQIKKTNANIDVSKIKVVVFCHFYYSDLIDEILTHIENLPCKLNDLWVSLPCSSLNNISKNDYIKQSKILERFPNANIKFVINRGKDIGGKLECLRDYLDKTDEGENDWMIFCHDKKSLHMHHSRGEAWRKSLLSNIFSKTNILNALSNYEDDNFVMWGGAVREGITNSRRIAVNLGNVFFLKKLISYFNIKTIPYTTSFIGGTMFWANDTFYRKMFNLIDINSVLMMLEKGNVKEPSHTHAIERIFGMIVTDAGKKIGKI